MTALNLIREFFGSSPVPREREVLAEIDRLQALAVLAEDMGDALANVWQDYANGDGVTENDALAWEALLARLDAIQPEDTA